MGDGCLLVEVTLAHVWGFFKLYLIKTQWCLSMCTRKLNCLLDPNIFDCTWIECTKTVVQFIEWLGWLYHIFSFLFV